MMVYDKDASGNPIVATDASGNQVGSATARVDLIGILSNPETVTVQIDESVAKTITSADGMTITLKPSEINGRVSGSVNVDKRTAGWGMTVMHEYTHTGIGGGLDDTPYSNATGNPGPAMKYFFDVNNWVFVGVLVIIYSLFIYLVLFKIKKIPNIKLYMVILVLSIYFISSHLLVFPTTKQLTKNASEAGTISSIVYALNGLFQIAFLIIGYIKYHY